MSATYRWIITKDHINRPQDLSELGTVGPRNASDDVKDNPQHFSLRDDDGECYLEGMFYGDISDGDPLEDIGYSYGCTQLLLKGKIVIG